jgi:hypothetical protein
MKPEFIITGTGRCGTVFLAKLLTSLGKKCGHESIFNYDDDDTIINRLITWTNFDISETSINNCEGDWIDKNTIIADSSYIAASFLCHPLLVDIPVIHIVRDPLKVIRSFIYDLKYFQFDIPNQEIESIYKYEKRIWEIIPELKNLASPIERASWYYYRWNQLIEKSCKYRKYLKINIENINLEDNIKNFLNIPSVSDTITIYNNKKCNSRDIGQTVRPYQIKNKFILQSIKNDYNI